MVAEITTLRADSIIESDNRQQAIDDRLPQETVPKSTPCFKETNPVQKTIFINPIWKKVKKGLDLEKIETDLAEKRCRAGRQLPVSTRGRVRDLVAVKAGFKSANSYVAAKIVYLNAHHEIKKIVDEGIIKITPASKIAKLGLNKQARNAKIIRMMANNLKNPKRAISFFITNLTKNQNTDCLANTILYGIQNGETCFKQILNKYEPKKTAAKKSNPGQPPVKTISQLHDSLAQCVISGSEIAGLDEKRIHDLDTKLSHIEKMSKNV